MLIDENLSNLFHQPQFAVDLTIAHDDEMLDFAHNQEQYFNVGQSALRCIRLAMLMVDRTDFSRILDLPCGHGRVLRVLKPAFPHSEIIACDINESGVNFCHTQFKVHPLISNVEPERIPLDGLFDLIWVGSLFTHLDAPLIRRFLRVLTEHLSLDGLLIFSTHGNHVASLYRAENRFHSMLGSYDKTGFAYEDYPNKKGYGNTLSSPSWIVNEVKALKDLQFLYLWERGWVGYQDVIALTTK